MNEVKLGQLIDGPAARDAIHIAVAPMVACQDLDPGDNVQLKPDGTAAYACPGDKGAVGIVDPFLTARVRKDQRFYVLLYPNTVTSLRHQWEHPAFAPQLPTFADVIRGEHGEKAQSELWLRQYAQKLSRYDSSDEAYRRLIDGLREGHLVSHGSDLYEYSSLDDADELQRHAEVVLGRPVNLRGFSFSCSC